MANNEILKFCPTDTGTNLLTQAEYDADTDRTNGNQSGIARSKLVNKALRQASLMAAGLGKFLSVNQADDVVDTLTADQVAEMIRLSIVSASIPQAVTMQYLIVNETQASGTDGGTFTSGAWRTRTLNTVQTNTIAGASLAANQITLPAGTWMIDARAPAFEVNLHKAILYNVTDSTIDLIGSTENTTNSASVTGDAKAQTSSVVSGIITIAAPKTFELRHQCSATQATTGFGSSCGFGVSEVYSIVKVQNVIV